MYIFPAYIKLCAKKVKLFERVYFSCPDLLIKRDSLYKPCGLRQSWRMWEVITETRCSD